MTPSVYRASVVDMGELKSAAWYDEYYRNNREPSAPLRAIHETAADLVIEHLVADPPTPHRPKRFIVDLGCGPGWFADTIQSKASHTITRDGSDGAIHYLGFDSSREAIDVAIRSRPQCARWSSLFACMEIEAMRPLADVFDVADTVVVVAVEVLEHIENDLVEWSRVVPIGARVVVSVPTYDSASHVRHFNSADDIAGRYGIDGLRFEKDRQIYVTGKRVR